MPNITVTTPPPKRKVVTSREMLLGQVGIIVEEGHSCKGHVVLRICDHIVSLNYPQEDWRVRHTDCKVELIPPGSTISFITEI